MVPPRAPRPRRRAAPIGRFLLGAAASLPVPLAAQEGGADDRSPAVAIHGQATLVVQATPGLRSPYRGPNSLTGRQAKETVDATLYAGVRPWAGTELWVNPEIDQGFGLSGTLGVAGFPSAEAYKVGRDAPYLRLQRLFVRQTIGLGGGRERVAGAANQFAGTRDTDRLVVTLGKIAVGDVFDTNAYAHDPRADLLNWALVDAGSFDYAADAWGYTTGAAIEAYRGAWAVRVGLFNLSRLPNGEALETGFGQHQLDVEVEHRHRIGGRDGAVRVTLFRSHGRFGRYADALALAATSGQAADLAPVRGPRGRAGVHLNAEQAVSDAAGLFARAGVADGSVEPYDFTDIDRTAQVGIAVRGAGWKRPRDVATVAFVVNGLSPAHRRYLDAGGLGLLVGDGRLPHPGAELIGEANYRLAALAGITLAADYQLVVNPGYNRDRGPATVLGLRLHGEF